MPTRQFPEIYEILYLYWHLLWTFEGGLTHMTMTNETFTQQNAEYSQLKDIEDVKVSFGIQFNELGVYILNLKLFSIKNKFWTIHKQAQSNPNFQISRFSQTLFDVGFVIYWGESDFQRYWCWKLQLTTDEMLQCYAAEQIFIYLRRGSVHKAKVWFYFIIQLPL